MTKREKIGKLTLEWCIENLGNPLKTIVPTLIISHDKRVKRTYGNYGSQTITVYSHVCLNDSRFVSTIIHEYAHYLQFPKMSYMKQYHKQTDKHGYDDNPYEVEARQFEEKYLNSCIIYINKNYK